MLRAAQDTSNTAAQLHPAPAHLCRLTCSMGMLWMPREAQGSWWCALSFTALCQRMLLQCVCGGGGCLLACIAAPS